MVSVCRQNRIKGFLYTVGNCALDDTYHNSLLQLRRHSQSDDIAHIAHHRVGVPRRNFHG